MRSRLWTGWRGTFLIAATYIYFLIFAQFAFLARIEALGFSDSGLKLIMTAMAGGGILLSLWTPRLRAIPLPALRMRIGFGTCALAALGSLLPLNMPGAAIVAFFIGAGLGITTVTMVTHLGCWTGTRNRLLRVGLGTGIGYFVCNIPSVFTSAPQRQALFAALVMLGAMALPLRESEDRETSDRGCRPPLSFGVALAAFAALIWLDSAAFYIVQHAPLLKAGTWMGTAHLWVNAFLHLGAAIAAGMLLQRGKLHAVVTCAIGALGIACVLLARPGLILSASLFYPLGVSFYSVALVAYPSFLSSARSAEERGRQAGWIYAIAGWVGSALGIGMGQNLGKVPLSFVAIAGAAVLAPILLKVMRERTREITLLALAAMVALAIYHSIPRNAAASDASAIEHGRQVYISEGCISCHSQYVRPNSGDVLMWGPMKSMVEVHEQQPPLIGNRRQGPDLSQVGARRSPLWIKAHLVDPRGLSNRSIMPSYAFLFTDQRGDDLVAYLSDLKSPEHQQLALQQHWQPSESAIREANSDEGRVLYLRNCATCHERSGAIFQLYRTQFKKPPEELKKAEADLTGRSTLRLDQIIKFGIAGTDMPGHEYWSDQQIASLAKWLSSSSLKTNPDF